MPYYRMAGGTLCYQAFPGEDGNPYYGLGSGTSVHGSVPADFYMNPERRGNRPDTDYKWQVARLNPVIELYDYKQEDSPLLIPTLETDARAIYQTPRTWRNVWVYDEVETAAPPSTDVFFENRHPIEWGMKPQTAAGMSGVLVE